MDADLTKLFDSYNLRARLYPAFISAAPVMATVLLLWPTSPIYSLWPVAVAVGVLLFLSTWVRGRGQAIEQRLVTQWDGLPTTRMLRHREGNDLPSLHRRRTRLMSTLSIALPSADDERDDPAKADDQYVTARKALISRVRQHQDTFPLVHEENIQYGFRRNLYAMKPIALSVLAANVIFDVYWLAFVSVSATGVVAACIHALLLCGWLFVVRPDWVWQQGRTYAERLFESIEDERLGPES